jgi:hypothetical protein
MLRHIVVACPLLVFLFVLPCTAQDGVYDGVYKFPEPKACIVPKEDSGLREEDELDWTPCEKWVWSCIRVGKEANLHDKLCVVPRSDESNQVRSLYRYAAFYEPDRYQTTNALSSAFLRKILKDYDDKIPPEGIRIFGAYFKDVVILENISTPKDMNLDGSIFKKGLRLANFHIERSLAFDKSNIRGAMELFRTRIDGSLFLSDGVYDRIDLRDGVVASSIGADHSVFNDTFSLDRARVGGDLNFEHGRLTVLQAHGANIGGSLRMLHADVRVRMDLTGSKVDGDVYLQRLQFGRQRIADGAPRCDWADLCIAGGAGCYDILRPPGPDVGDESDVAKKIRQETDRHAPVVLYGEEPRPPDVCINSSALSNPFEPTNEVLLRDMSIKGTLCLLGVSGHILDAENKPSNQYFVKTISLDGTETKTTVLRFEDSESPTLWRVVNFKTSYILLSLPDHPPSHFMNNIDFGFITLNVPEETAPVLSGSEADYILCDEDPAPFSAIPLSHQRLVKFFTGATNRSHSSQPFAKVIERLQDAGVTSNYLRNALFDFQVPNYCTTSALTRTWQKLSADERWEATTFWEKIKRSWIEAPRSEIRGSGDAAVEGVKFLLDGICSWTSGSYKYGAFLFRGNPFVAIFVFDLVVFSVIMILLFRFLLIFDKSGLGLMYSIDMFHPFHRFRFSSAHTDAQPNKPMLRSYRKFHSVIGAISTVLLVVLVYFAAK